MTNDLSKIILFGGNLEELEDKYNEQYEVVGDYYQSKSYYYKYSDENCKKELLKLGYDGLIHRQNHSDIGIHTFFIPAEIITGVPVRLIRGEK